MAKAKLSTLFTEVHGKIGNIVVEMVEGEATIRPLPTTNNPNTPAQQSIRNNFSASSKLFASLTPAQQAAWRVYATDTPRKSPGTGKLVRLNPVAALNELTSKFLQINPGGTAPIAPPTASFNGETLRVIASGDTEWVLFTATAANTVGVKTELLLVKVPTAGTVPPLKAYRSRAFMGFAVGALEREIIVPPGFYAAAYRFVKVATGQKTSLVTLGVVIVP